MNGLKNCGVEDVLIAIVDGLKGFPEAITAVFPQATVQPASFICCITPGFRLLESPQARGGDAQGYLPGRRCRRRRSRALSAFDQRLWGNWGDTAVVPNYADSDGWYDHVLGTGVNHSANNGSPANDDASVNANDSLIPTLPLSTSTTPADPAAIATSGVCGPAPAGAPPGTGAAATALACHFW